MELLIYYEMCTKDVALIDSVLLLMPANRFFMPRRKNLLVKGRMFGLSSPSPRKQLLYLCIEITSMILLLELELV